MSAGSEEAVTVQAVRGAEDRAIVHELFVEYADWLDFDLCFQGFDEELATLPGKYAPPEGGLWLARVGGAPAGVVGMRPLDEGICELKRLWVRPAFRGRDLGRRLTESAIAAARQAGYRTMRLDTIGGLMREARTLYESLGFQEAAAYYRNPHPGADYMELLLQS